MCACPATIIQTEIATGSITVALAVVVFRT